MQNFASFLKCSLGFAPVAQHNFARHSGHKASGVSSASWSGKGQRAKGKGQRSFPLSPLLFALFRCPFIFSAPLPYGSRANREVQVSAAGSAAGAMKTGERQKRKGKRLSMHEDSHETAQKTQKAFEFSVPFSGQENAGCYFRLCSFVFSAPRLLSPIGFILCRARLESRVFLA